MSMVGVNSSFGTEHADISSEHNSSGGGGRLSSNAQWQSKPVTAVFQKDCMV